MRKALFFFVLAIFCVVLAFRYFRRDVPSFADASEDLTGNIADFRQPLPHTVTAALSWRYEILPPGSVS